MEWKQKYYLVESGEIRERAEIYRQALIARHKELQAITKSLGAQSYQACSWTLKLRGVGFEGEVPKGFKKPDSYGMCRPYKKNTDALEHFTKSGTIERFPPYLAFFDWLGCPQCYSFDTDDGWGNSSIGHPGEPYGLYWYDPEGPILLMVPDVEDAAVKAQEQGHRVRDNALDWRIHPTHPGATEILYERWQWMRAEYKQQQELAA